MSMFQNSVWIFLIFVIYQLTQTCSGQLVHQHYVPDWRQYGKHYPQRSQNLDPYNSNIFLYPQIQQELLNMRLAQQLHQIYGIPAAYKTSVNYYPSQLYGSYQPYGTVQPFKTYNSYQPYQPYQTPLTFLPSEYTHSRVGNFESKDGSESKEPKVQDSKGTNLEPEYRPPIDSINELSTPLPLVRETLGLSSEGSTYMTKTPEDHATTSTPLSPASDTVQPSVKHSSQKSSTSLVQETLGTSGEGYSTSTATTEANVSKHSDGVLQIEEVTEQPGAVTSTQPKENTVAQNNTKTVPTTGHWDDPDNRYQSEKSTKQPKLPNKVR